jgi:uncharacterized phosphosugar-binding protein
MSAAAYLAAAAAVVDTVVRTQQAAVEQAGKLVAHALGAGHRLWTFGTGHSHMLAEELYWRAGGLDGVRAVLEPSLMLHEGALKSSALEKLPGLAAVLLEQHDVAAGDVVIVASNSGRNAVPVEFAEQCRRRGAVVIAVTSLAHAEAVTSRAPSGRSLHQVADLVLDNCGAPGDTAITLAGPPPRRAGATSTIAGALLVQAVACEAAALLDAAGNPPEILSSFNLDPEGGSQT